MFDSIKTFMNKIKKNPIVDNKSKDAAKERLHLVLVQDRANVSADFLDLMKQEIIEVIKKYIDIDEESIDVHLTNKTNSDGTTGSPALYANIPIISIKNEARKISNSDKTESSKSKEKEDTKEKIKEDKEVYPETEVVIQEFNADENNKASEKRTKEKEEKSEEVNN